MSRPSGRLFSLPLGERRRLSAASRQRSLDLPLSERHSLPVVDRQRSLRLLPSGRRAFVRAPSGCFRGAAFGGGGLPGPAPAALLRFAAHRAAELPVVDRQRVPFLLAQERNQRRARGAAPLRPPRRLRLAFGQSRRRPVTDKRTSLQHPASRRAAGAMPLPESPRNALTSAAGGTIES